MRHLIRIILCAALAAILGAVPICGSVRDSVIDTEEPGTIIIDYKDDIAGTGPVSGAEFAVYRVADIGPSGQYIPVVEGMTIDESTTGADVRDSIRTAYGEGTEEGHGQLQTTDSEGIAVYGVETEEGHGVVQTTDSEGIAVFGDLLHGLYLVMETKAAEKHLPSEPVLVSVPYTKKCSAGDSQDGEDSYNYWEFTVRIFPKPHKTGELVIKKTVEGTGGDREKGFHFSAVFDKDGEYRFTCTTGQTGTIKSGELIALKDGESVTIDGIPVGCGYRVLEKEANTDGYRTTATGAVGKIQYRSPQTAAFVNTKQAPTPTPRQTVTPTPKQNVRPTPTSYEAPPRVRTGDSRKIVGWVMAVMSGLLILIASSRRSGK